MTCFVQWNMDRGDTGIGGGKALRAISWIVMSYFLCQEAMIEHVLLAWITE